MNKNNIKLSPKQEQVWQLLQETPKQRRIIWVTGSYGSGKSFLYNYIKTNHDYGMYDAGQTASMDNLAYGYDEEGVISWDLPRTFDFQTMGDAIANVIEKFSDFGQSITSKKYNGKTQNVRGHAIVFSNHPPLEQLTHRDIIHINLTPKDEDVVQLNNEQKTYENTANNTINQPELYHNTEIDDPVITQHKTDHPNITRLILNGMKTIYKVIYTNTKCKQVITSLESYEEALDLLGELY